MRFTTSMVMIVEAELSVEATEAMVAATNPAATSPRRRIDQVGALEVRKEHERKGAGQHHQEEHRQLQ
jgi:hypothetical protein